MPILPALVDQVVQMVNVLKASPGSKKVAKDDPEEWKIFLVSPVFYYVDYLYSCSE